MRVRVRFGERDGAESQAGRYAAGMYRLLQILLALKRADVKPAVPKFERSVERMLRRYPQTMRRLSQ